MTATTDAQKVADLERRFEEERRRRIDLERQLAGTRSAVMKLQATLAKHKAEEAERRAGDER